MSCKIEYVVDPNGEMSKLFKQLVDITGDQQRALEVYLDAIDLSFDSYNDQGEPTLEQLDEAGLLRFIESLRVSKGPKTFNKISIEDDAVEAVVTQLDNAINNLTRQLHEGLPEGEKQSLKDQIDALQKDKGDIINSSASLSSVARAAERHFKWAKSLNEDSEPREIMHAIKLLDLWDYEKTTKKFLTEDQKNEDNPHSKRFRSIDKEALKIKDRVISTAYKAFQKQIKKDFGEEVDIEQLQNLSEIGLSKQYLLNISHVDEKLIQYFNVVTLNAKRGQDGAIKEVQQELDRLSENIEDPQVILRKDENGNAIDEFVSPFSRDYYEKRSSALSEFYRSIENAGDKGPSQQTKINKNARKKLYKKLNDLEIVFNPNRVYDDDYREELINEGIDEEIVDYAIIQAKDNVERYKSALESYREYILSEIRTDIWKSKRLNEDETFNEYKDRKMRNFRTQNSPYLYYEDRSQNKVDYPYNTGYNYNYSLPSKEEYYDDTFQNFTEEEREFWKYVTGIIQRTASYLPEHVTRNIDESFVPKIKKSFIEQVTNNGARYASREALRDFWNNVRSNDVQELNPDEELEYEDVFSGVGDRNSVPIRFINDPDIPSKSIAKSRKKITSNLEKLENEYTNNNIDQEEYESKKEEYQKQLDNLKKKQKDQSFDVIKLTQMFASMAYNYKNMTEVVGHGELIHRLVEEANTVEGSEIVSKSGPINLADAIKEEMNYLFFGVSKDEEQWASSTLDFVPDNPIKFFSKNAEKRRLENERDQLEVQLENGEISQSDYDENMADLEKQYRELGGKSIVWSKVIDNTLLPFAQLKGMGFNVLAGLRNLGYGIYSNIIHAQGGEEFTTQNVRDAFRIMLDDLTYRKGKVSNLVDKFGILFEVAEIRYGKDRSDFNFNPYFIQSWTEFFGQGLTMVSSMLNETVTDLEGNERPLYEAFDNNGNWKTEEFGEKLEWQPSSIKENRDAGEKFLSFGNRVKQTNNMIHGDYSKDSKQLIKKFVQGRLISMFRTWLPEAVTYRFGKTRMDQHLGREVTGFYRHTAETILDNPRWDTFKTILQAYTPFADVHSEKLDDAQVASIKRMMMEMRVITMLTITIIAMKASIDDDEERTAAAKVLINQLVMLNSDISLYISPTQMIDLAKNPIPAASVITDYNLLMEGAWRHLSDEDYQGDHPIWKVTKATPILKQINTARFQVESVIEE